MPEPTAAPAAGPRERPHRRRSRVVRLPVVITVAAVVAIGVLVGRQGPASAGAPPQPAPGPQVASSAALSSTWFCAGATDSAHGEAPGQVVVTNAGSRSLVATVTMVPDHGARRTVSVPVAAESQAEVAETVPGGAAWIGAVVDLDGGGASVEQRLSGSLGTATQPCATSSSTRWYFTSAATLINADSEITLLDPYPTAAIANLTFTTDEGVEQPGAFQGIVVPADGLVAVDLRSHLRRRSFIAASVSVSAGRLVAWKTDIVSPPPAGTPYLGSKAAEKPDADPASPVLGLTETLGAPAVSRSWYWPQGSTAAGLDEQYAIYNPGARTARVQLAFALEQGSAQPLALSVGPDALVRITAADQARIPVGSTYSVRLTASNGVGVVATRTVAAQAPSTWRGTAALLGAQQGATSWLVGAGSSSTHLDEEVEVSNPGSRAVTVGAKAVGRGAGQAIPGLTSLSLSAGAQTTWDLGALDPSLSGGIVVTGTGPVVVAEQLTGRHGANGVGLSLAVPYRR